MMQFLVIGRDDTDEQALERRLASREKHIELGDEAVQKGEQIVGVALLNDEGQMCGSAMIVNFPSRVELDEWLKKEPYITGKVWEKVEVIPCKIGPSFQHILEK